jgi:formylglycine-generating enzyme required for sulfatase activity
MLRGSIRAMSQNPSDAAATVIGDPNAPYAGQVWGDIELVRLLGKGGMGSVYLGRQRSLDRTVAVKVLPEHLGGDEQFRRRFMLEAKAIALVSHANVIQVYAAGTHERHHYFVMEFVDGGDLSARVKSGWRPTRDEAIALALQAARGLVAAGERGLVHRDIKPGNMLLDKKGVLKLTDFGLVKLATGDHGMTITGTIMGTVSYFSPEQGRGLPCDCRTDIYALGVVLYELLTGKLPFTGSEPTSVIYQHIHTDPPLPRSIDASLGEDVQQVVLTCLQKKPEERYQTAAELVADLERLQRGEKPAGRSGPAASATVVTTLAAGAAGAAIPAATPPAARPWWPIAAAILGVVGLAAAAVAIARPWDSPAPTQAHMPEPPPRGATPTTAPATPAAGPVAEPAQAATVSADAAEGSRLLKKAIEAESRGELTAALAAATAAQRLIPADATLADLLQRLHRQRGDLDAAIGQSDALLGRHQASAARQALAVMAVRHPREADLIAAQQRVAAAEEREAAAARTAAAQVAQGEQALAAHDWAAAEAAFTSARTLDPGSAVIARGLAAAENGARSLAAARAGFDQALAAGDLAAAEIRLSTLRDVATMPEAAAAADRLAKARAAAQAAALAQQQAAAPAPAEQPAAPPAVAVAPPTVALPTTAPPAATTPAPVAARAPARPAWASEVGQDDHGAWADVAVRGVTVRFRYLPAGTFVMGSPADEKDRRKDEPQRQVTITKAFYLADSETTQQLWTAVTGRNPSAFKGDLHAVNEISWKKASEFCVQVNGQVPGLVTRLPTEAEWEYACRAGSTAAFFADPDEIAWHRGNSRGKAPDVRTRAPNAWGLFDMQGGVYEWVADAWSEPAATDPVSDPLVAGKGKRVIRGGCWNTAIGTARAAARRPYDEGGGWDVLGFRLAVSVDDRP